MAVTTHLVKITKTEARKRWNNGLHVAFSKSTVTKHGTAYTRSDLPGTFDFWVAQDGPIRNFYAPVAAFGEDY